MFYGLTDNISATQNKLQYDTGFAMQDNATQHWWYSTILVANTISNTGKLAKTAHPDSFGEDSDITQTKEIDDCR